VATIGPISPTATLCDRYRLQRLLATGGMASVWLASDRLLDRPVAVKVIADTLAVDESWVRRFQREARVAASLNHPNIARVFDSGSDRGRPFLVMEFVTGGTLADLLHRGDALAPERLARELLGAVRHIHEAGLLHRDIKPANVLLTETQQARLTDFGVALPAETTRLTRTGMIVGTAGYLAPEVLAGGCASERSDLFSCGRVIAAVAARRPGEPRLSRLITALTDPEPSRRPASAAAALRALSAEEEPSTRPTIEASAPATTRRIARGRGPTPRGRSTAPLAGARTVYRRRPGPAGRRGAAGAAVVAAVAAIVLIVAGAGAGSPAPSRAPRPAARQAPLAQQLQAVEERVRYAERH
jgi:serine/threonine protein kinase